jgi:hypothetical protein
MHKNLRYLAIGFLLLLVPVAVSAQELSTAPAPSFIASLEQVLVSISQDLAALASAHNGSSLSQTAAAAASCGALPVGGTLVPGQSIWSCNGAYQLIFQTDGNLVLYSTSKALWASGTNGKQANELILQSDGNLVLYGATPLWATGTSGKAVTGLAVQNDGNVVLYDGSTPLWATNTMSANSTNTNTSAPATAAPTVSLTQNPATTTETNNVGQPFTLSWTSANAASCILQQQTPSGTIVNPWATGTSGTGTGRPGAPGIDHYWIDCTGAGGSAHADIYHTVTAAAAAAPAKPTGSITSSAGTSISVGQSTTITLNATAAAGDTLQYLYINQSLNGAAQTNVQPSQGNGSDVYTFTPAQAGTYTFYGWSYSTASAPNWYPMPGVSVTVTVTASPAQQPVSTANAPCGQLAVGATLSVGQSIASCNGAYSLVLQSDGNLVLYSATKALWATNTNGKTATQLLLQSDGNLVLYGQTAALWASGTGGDTVTRLSVGDDGNLSLYNGSVLVWYTNTALVRGQTVAALNQNDPMTWLIKSVCVNAQNQELSVDPYGGCPAGDTIRKLNVGDGLPYYNYALGGIWSDFPFTGLDGHEYVLRFTEPYPAPSDRAFQYGDGQFDVYGVNINNDGWVSAPNTQDNYTYGGTFFGPNCEVGGGWGLFPAANFLSTGFTHLMAGDIAAYYQNGQSFPGTCPPLVGTIGDGWSYQKNFAFGAAGQPPKYMDTIIAYHGYSSGTSFQQHNIMEVFYFTREYGITRYEQWTPIQQNPVKDTRECNNPDTVTYQGQVFVITDCADFSETAPAAPPFAVPVAPVPNVNLLKYPNFDAAFKNSWIGGGADGQGNQLVWNLSTSKTYYDTRSRNGQGVNYIQLACGNPSVSGSCNANPWGEFIAQDIPAASFTNGSTYGYGVAVKTESGSGTIGLTIQELDATKTHVLGYVTKTETVTPESGYDPNGNSASVYLPATFVYSTFKLNLAPGTAYLRFVVAPQTPKIYFDVSYAWFAPWPVAGAPQATLGN